LNVWLANEALYFHLIFILEIFLKLKNNNGKNNDRIIEVKYKLPVCFCLVLYDLYWSIFGGKRGKFWDVILNYILFLEVHFGFQRKVKNWENYIYLKYLSKSHQSPPHQIKNKNHHTNSISSLKGPDCGLNQRLRFHKFVITFNWNTKHIFVELSIEVWIS
jgi:hypothetical protein